MKRPGAWKTGSRREEAEDLRTRAAAIRTAIDDQKRTQRQQREAEAAKLEAQELEAQGLEAKAREIDLEQGRADKAAALRTQADAAEASAAELDTQASQLDVQVLEAAIRAARFEEQLGGDVAQRRHSLEQRATAAAESGDADAVLEAERDIALLPTLEARLREQADTASSRATELNADAAKVESQADALRRTADTLRGWADTDPLSPAAPPLPEQEQKMRERERVDLGARLLAREAALRAVRAIPGPGDPDDAAAVFAREITAHREARAQALHAEDVERLEEVTRLVGQVRDETLSESDRRMHAPLGAVFTAPIAGIQRQELEASIASYQGALGRELPRCHDLATGSVFGIVGGRFYPDRFAAAVCEAADAADEELALERAALDSTLEAD